MIRERLRRAIPYLIDQARQASTWRGVILVVTSLCGWTVSEEKVGAVVLIGVALAGLVGLLLPDQLTKKDGDP
jgi:multidrug transporter EmrE-like cation transporter